MGGATGPVCYKHIGRSVGSDHCCGLIMGPGTVGLYVGRQEECQVLCLWVAMMSVGDGEVALYQQAAMSNLQHARAACGRVPDSISNSDGTSCTQLSLQHCCIVCLMVCASHGDASEGL